MISETFDSRTLSKMEIALDRACLILPAGSDKHRIRRIIAGKILECAHRGDKKLVIDRDIELWQLDRKIGTFSLKEK